MTDTNLLKKKITDSGKTITFLSKSLGISRQALYEKINSRTGFYTDEMAKLSDELNLTMEEREQIFFTEKVD